MNARLEAFCDGVFAFALTLLIVDVRVPNAESIRGTAEAWSALRHLGPSFFAFILSFVVILITWVNHHNTLKLVNASSVPFIYANGLLLLGVVCIPFTTATLGAFLLTDHAAPGVALYNTLLVVQAVGWLAITGAVLRNRLYAGEHALIAIREFRNRAYAAVALYTALALLGLWLPLSVAAVTTGTWLLWLVLSLGSSRYAHVAA